MHASHRLFSRNLNAEKERKIRGRLLVGTLRLKYPLADTCVRSENNVYTESTRKYANANKADNKQAEAAANFPTIVTVFCFSKPH